MESPLLQLIARFWVLRDSRPLSLAVALALTLGNCVASGDLFAVGRRHHRWPASRRLVDAAVLSGALVLTQEIFGEFLGYDHDIGHLRVF